MRCNSVLGDRPQYTKSAEPMATVHAAVVATMAPAEKASMAEMTLMTMDPTAITEATIAMYANADSNP